ncbi:hypothetical protein QTP70_018118, partial [Hemibagrus guttatus]
YTFHLDVCFAGIPDYKRAQLKKNVLLFLLLGTDGRAELSFSVRAKKRDHDKLDDNRKTTKTFSLRRNDLVPKKPPVIDFICAFPGVNWYGKMLKGVHNISDQLYHRVHRRCDRLHDHHHSLQSEAVDDCKSACFPEGKRLRLQSWGALRP